MTKHEIHFIPVICILLLVQFLLPGTIPSALSESSTIWTSLSTNEQEWLSLHRDTIRIAHSPDWPPMDFTGKDGKPSGMVADYISLIEKKLDIRFVNVPVSDWKELLDRARKREIDIISAGQATEDRWEYMYWSTPYLNLNTTIIVKKSRQGQLALDQMAGMKIGVPKAYAVGEFIRNKYPELTLVDVKNGRDGINKVSFGEVDAMVTEVPNALYLIESEKITNLRLGGVTGFQLRHSLGIRKDWPVFAGIVEKALASITPEEHQAIQARWVWLETIRFYQTSVFWYTVLAIFTLSLVSIGVVLLWNRTLKNQVLQRTQELRNNEKGLEALLELNERTYESIQEIIEFAFLQMVRLTRSRFGYLAFDDQEGMLYIINSAGPEADSPTEVKRLPDGLDRETIGFWGEAVRKGRPIISNNYFESNPNSRGVPSRYNNIFRYMNVPIFSKDRVILVVGMGNKQTNYTASDLRQLNLLAQGMWRLIQRKKAEQAIRSGEKRFQDLVDNSPNGIAIYQGGSIVYRNPRQLELAGSLNLFDESIYPYIHKGDLKKVKRFQEALRKPLPEGIDADFRFYTNPDMDDQPVMKWVSCTATPIEFQEKSAVLLITLDMTEAKDLERLLVVQDKMASLGHVSAGIAHEIRNPLSGININLHTIEKNLGNHTKQQKVEQSIDAIRAASRKIEGVIRRVMDFAKPAEPKSRPVDINIPLEEAADLTRVSLRKRGITLHMDLAENLPQCNAEPQLIEEVILNLVNNAAEALGDGPEEKIIRLGSALVDDKVIISVEDNGPGVSRELREKIFEPFYTSKEHSTGIGLSLCHRVIVDHKGTLTVGASDYGGAKFRIALPLLSGQREEVEL